MLNNKSLKFESTFTKEFGKILLYQLAFQILFTGIIYALNSEVDPVQYVNFSAYVLIFLICLHTLKYTIANKPLVILFIIQFGVLAFVPIIMLLILDLSYNFNVFMYMINYILSSSVALLITAYLFFHSISPKISETKNHLLLGMLITAAIILLINFDVNLFIDYDSLANEALLDEIYKNSMDEIVLGKNYVYIINLSFLLFIWFTYNQGHYILSEYLPSILSIHTLMIINEIYQFSNYTPLLQNYISAQYFNTIVNVGFILIWIIRLSYLTNPENKKNENYVLNYDLLKGYVQKPNKTFWQSVLIKLGKQKLYFGSFILFLIISIPLLFLGELSYFMRYNIVLMLLFLVGVMIYAIIYTQRKWFNHVGFLIQRKNK